MTKSIGYYVAIFGWCLFMLLSLYPLVKPDYHLWHFVYAEILVFAVSAFASVAWWSAKREL